MIIALLFLAILILVFFYLAMQRHQKKSLKKLKESYDENKDLSRRGEEQGNKGAEKRNRRTKKTKHSSSGPSKPKGQSSLQTADPNLSRKNSSGLRGILAKLRTKK